MHDARLRIYLNDHLAGSTAGIELARRCQRENKEILVGVRLARLLPELEAERAALLDYLGRVGGRVDRFKRGAAWMAEKVARLKLNGNLIGYSDLSRVEELEALLLGVRARLGLWEVLDELTRGDPRFSDVDWEALEAQSQRHVETLTEERMRAARQAFLVAA